MAPSPEPRPMPEGTVTFLFSDLEGSTRLLETYGAATGVALEPGTTSCSRSWSTGTRPDLRNGR